MTSRCAARVLGVLCRRSNALAPSGREQPAGRDAEVKTGPEGRHGTRGQRGHALHKRVSLRRALGGLGSGHAQGASVHRSKIRQPLTRGCHYCPVYILTRRISVRCAISSNHNGQQQCHQKSLLPPCHRARSQPASHPKKACYGCGAPRNSTTPTHVSMSDVVPQPGTWVRACLPRSPPLDFSRLFHVRCPCFQATMTNSATTTDNMLAVWTVTVYINQDTTITQVVR